MIARLRALLFTPSIYSHITRLAKLYDPLQVICILLDRPGQRKVAVESIKPTKKLDSRVVFSYKILQVEKVNISRADCKKYGVYLLLSDQQVYVGQASDLERRTKQHLADKDWWTKVILMTTKDDSFNASDIDYLESSLITLAGKAGKSDSDNKKRGNPQKVDEFRQAELEQYLEEALFLLELIGIRVFKKDTKKVRRTNNRAVSIETAYKPEMPAKHVQSISNCSIPSLPNESLKIGEFVYTAMRNLAGSGYSFNDNELEQMMTSEWSSTVFHTTKPFMKRYIPGQTDNKGSDGRIRFKSEPFTFGDTQVLISKEWYERQRQFFIAWYSTLK